jgi:hypothetical protein
VTALDLAALDAARAAATPGPWRQDAADPTEIDAHCGCGVDYPNHAQGVGDTLVDTDAALIVASVNALPDLIAAARERDALRDAVLRLADALEADAGTFLQVIHEVIGMAKALGGEH